METSRRAQSKHDPEPNLVRRRGGERGDQEARRPKGKKAPA